MMSMKALARLALVLAAILALTPQAPAGAATLHPILLGYWGHPSLLQANGNKIALGRFNHLHAVFTNADVLSATLADIEYVDMGYDPSNTTDPYVWTDQQLTYDGRSSLPAVAVDGSGLAAVVWVTKASPSDPLGAIYYAHQTALNCPSCWTTPQQIVVQGTEPSITTEGATVHLAWTTGDRVEYASFPSSTPPAMPLWLGEVVDSTNCPGTHFHLPSIALTHQPCLSSPTVRIASLLAANEQATAGSCHSASTQSGPRVYERNSTTQTWSTSFQEVVSDPAPSQPNPSSVSISLNANRVTGDFYLAWSEVQNLTARTRAGHGNLSTWDASQLVDPQARHVQVTAQGGGAGGLFRLALSDQGWSSSPNTRTGKWSAGALTWTGPTITIPGGYDPLARHPQALYWSRCAANQLSTVRAYTEASPSNTGSYTDMAIDPTVTGPVNCRAISVSNAISLSPCYTVLLSIAQMLHRDGSTAVLVDLGDYAATTTITDSGAQITTLSGATIQVTWTPGAFLYSWDNGFAVATSKDSVRFTSKDGKFSVEDFGTLSALGGK